MQTIASVNDNGTDKVSMVRVTADLAEMNRRAAEDKAREQRCALASQLTLMCLTPHRRRRVEEEQQQLSAEYERVSQGWAKTVSLSNYQVPSLSLAPPMSRSCTQDLTALLAAQKEACDRLIAEKEKVVQGLTPRSVCAPCSAVSHRAQSSRAS